jgi:hypothetical protein
MKPKRLQIILATTLFALLLWASVNLGGQHQLTMSVPVEVSPVPEGVALRSPIPEAIDLSLRGGGWALADLLWRSKPRYYLNLAEVAGFRDLHMQRVITARDIQRHLQLPATVELIDVKPESLFVAFEPAGRKRVPLVFKANMTFAEGFGLAGQPVIRPETILVSGAASVLDSITSWRLKDTMFQQLRAPVEVMLAPEEGFPFALSFTPRRVLVRLNVEPFAEKSFSNILVEVRSVPPNREVILIPPRIEIVLRGGINRLAAIVASDCRAYLHYEEVESDTSGSLVPVIEIPRGVTLISKRPERLEYVVRRRL